MRQAFGAIGRGYESLKANEVEIERLNRLYSSLSRVNQAIARSPTRDELFQRVCRILVEEGGFRMAWIGGPDPEGRLLLPVSRWGDKEGYLDKIRISTEDCPEGRGPAGTAFREKRAVVCNDIGAEPSFLPWRVAIERTGYRASATFPILEHDRKALGVLTVYADIAGYFQDKEVQLLQEVAGDIAFALRNIAEMENRKQAERSALNERLFSDNMIESMPGILYFYDDQGRILRWNRNFETVTGYSGAEIAAMHPLEFFASHEKDAVRDRIAEVFASGDSWIEASFLAKNGTTIPYYFTGRRVDYEGAPCLVGVGVDISERKRAEEALRELNGQLEGIVEERTRELRTAVIRAEAADRIKSAFLASMSHELRTPLNSIIGFTGILLKELAGPLTGEQQKQLGMVQASARHLLDLINDVLDISKIEAGQLELRAMRFALRESLEQVTALVKPQAESKGLELELIAPDDPMEMVGDQRRVEQILLNLANNAVKFTARGGVKIIAETEPAGPIPTAIRVRVVDTGIGIKEEDMGKLYQPFRQLDAGLARQHEGTGLGLAICRRLAELMGHTITATSEWGRGSTFTVLLPIQKPEDP